MTDPIPQVTNSLRMSQDYRYSCYVTNMKLPLDQICNVYNTQAYCENRIKNSKMTLAL